MEVVILGSAEEASRLAARIMARLVRRKPRCVLGLATGATPVATYAELVRLHREEGLDFSHVTTFNLDEYVGLGPDHPASYHAYMRRHLFSGVDLEPRRIHVPDGLAQDIARECLDYEEAIFQAGGVDLQLLGLGVDAHIGFNEPTSSLGSRTRIKTLDDSTVEANARFFREGEAVPRHVITMGIQTIMGADHCLVLAFGNGKARAVARMVEGPVTAMAPASVLQMHPHVTVLLDGPAAEGLAMRAYYENVYKNKPAWQSLG